MIWSDFACPFCYIGERRLQDAIKELGWEDKFQIKYKAFELDQNAPKESQLTSIERLSKKYRISESTAKSKIEAIDAQGRELGIDFRYQFAKPSNTFDAHRLMKLAEIKYDSDTVDKLNEALFDAYFVKNLVLSDKTVLLETALSVGLKEEDIMKTLDTDQFEKSVRDDEHGASMIGIKGVPYIVFNNKYAIPGALSIDDFKKVLEEVFEDEPVNLTEKAETCDQSGCSL